jgi:hypothetical protein
MMQNVCAPNGTIALTSRVGDVVNAINANQVIPYGDYGGPQVYYFQTFDNGLGNIVYTVFDRDTSIGLSSFMVRYSVASTIYQVIFGQMIRSQIDIQFLALPAIQITNIQNGTVTP